MLDVPGSYTTIQTALNAAAPGDQIVVQPGIYKETLLWPATENLTLRSSDPTSTSVVGNTVIDADGASTPVIQLGSVPESAHICGVTLRASSVAGISGNQSAYGNVLVERCRIVGNYGPGLRYLNGTFRANEISDNQVTGTGYLYGGGISYCQGLAEQNQITSNSITSSDWMGNGGGVGCFDGKLLNNTIRFNSAVGRIGAEGGGVYQAASVVGNEISDNRSYNTNATPGGYSGGVSRISGELIGNVIVRNYASYGGGGAMSVSGLCSNNLIAYNSAGKFGAGMWYVDAQVLNCTICYNSSGQEGAALQYANNLISNCIIWGNTPVASCLRNCATPSYSCTDASAGTAQSVLAADPRFADPANGDLRLQPGSPCIDAGNKYLLFNPPVHDVLGNCRLAGSSVDMGACEYAAGSDSDGDLLSDAQEQALGTQANNMDTDGDGLIDGVEVDRGTSPLSADLPQGIQVTPTSGTIQQAIFHALPDEVITLASGTYRENPYMMDKPLTLQGPQPMSHASIRDTVIDGRHIAPVLYFHGAETTRTCIRGLSLANGLGATTWGANPNGADQYPWATFENLFVYGNAPFPYSSSSGSCYVYGNWRNCVVFNNSSLQVKTSGIIDHCTFFGNATNGISLVGQARLTNSILWSIAAGAQIDATSPVESVEHCDIIGWIDGGPGNIKGDPLLRDPAYGDFRLRSGSPCIDAASPADTLASDYEGDARAGQADIGADEYIVNDQAIQVTPISSLPFGMMLLDQGSTGPLAITITNTGTDPLGFTGESFSIQGSAAADYSITNNPSHAPLEPGQSRVIEVSFDPSRLGVRMAELLITHNDTDRPDVRIALSGRGVTDLSTPVRLYDGQGPGVSTIGDGGDYPSLKLACQAVNCTPLSGGDWTFEIISDLTETDHVELAQETNSHTITFRPSKNTTPTITFATTANPASYASHWVIGSPRTLDVNGQPLLIPTSHVVIDGSNVAGGNSRDLTITNTTGSTGRSTLVQIVGNSDSNTVKNTRLINHYTGGSSTFGVQLMQVYSPSAGLTSAIPDNCTVENCEIVNNDSGPAQGISVGINTGSGAPLTGSTGTVLRGNSILARCRGMFLADAQQALVTSNTIRVNQTSYATHGFGILLNDQGATLNNAQITISGNQFTQLNAATNSGAGHGITGIDIEYLGNGNRYTITNNMIGGLKLTSTAAASATHLCGIRHVPSNNAQLEVYHNSINIVASDVAYSGVSAPNCAGIGITGAGFTGKLSAKDNIIRVAQPGGAALAVASTGATLESDYNDLSTTGGAVCGRLGSTSYATLAQWQTAASGLDPHSRDIDPTMANTPFSGKWLSPLAQDSDLHFDAYPGNSYAGTKIEGIDTDIDGQTRSATAPYMGADEYSAPAALADSDGDGTADEVEAANGTGDANADGIQDALQANVVSIPNAKTGEFVTLAAPALTRIENVVMRQTPAAPDLPQEMRFPLGFVSFDVTGVAAGGTVTVDLLLPEGVHPTTYYKHGPKPGNTLPSWYEFAFDGQTGAVVSGNKVTLYLQDGGRGDSDLTANGRIADPGAPAVSYAGIAEWQLF